MACITALTTQSGLRLRQIKAGTWMINCTRPPLPATTRRKLPRPHKR